MFTLVEFICENGTDIKYRIITDNLGIINEEKTLKE